MKSQEIREKFLRFFEKRGHKIMPSFSLIPDDETVLFTTAGMQQFKKYYLNPREAPSSRIITIQKCFRTSDIEEVGDKTHLTFFEMMGNFSFGYPKIKKSYFKEEAIKWAWEFLTEKEWLGIDKKRISATYFEGDKEKNIPEDNKSLEILRKIEGLPKDKIKPQGFDDNFWSLGTEGSPGGPTVEFYIDGVEIWNLVFNEYIFKNGKYEPFDFKGVDTGMGLERLTAIIQKKDNVFETDLLKPIYDSLEKEFKQAPETLRKITDHIKASCFLIEQGIIPASKHKKGKASRGSVLRTLLRTSMVYASLIPKKDWYIQPIKETTKIYQNIYPEIERDKENIIKVFQNEESEFGERQKRTISRENKRIKVISRINEGCIDSGDKKWITSDLKIAYPKDYEECLKKIIKGTKNNLSSNASLMSGASAFVMESTYGRPHDLFFRRLKSEIPDLDIDSSEQNFRRAVKAHQEISNIGAEKKFKGGLADESYETTKLHTAAHLLLQALREVLGDHVVQKGSNITQERLRFDFSHPEKLTEDQIKKVEDLVNKKIKENLPVVCQEMTLKEAKRQGAMGVFEERYGDKVKVYSVGDFSREICGGPHVKNTSELGEFKIKKEESVGAGIRRIKAILF